MTDHGKRILNERWMGFEHEVMTRVWEAGAPVPYPVGFSGDGMLLEYVGDESQAAPTLGQARLTKPEIASAAEQLVDGLRLLMEVGIVHADLSAFNLLWWDGPPRSSTSPRPSTWRSTRTVSSSCIATSRTLPAGSHGGVSPSTPQPCSPICSTSRFLLVCNGALPSCRRPKRPEDRSVSAEPKKLLEGVRIVECSMLGPAGISTSLADLGADVIKIEPPTGDYVREMTWPIVEGVSLMHLHLNRGKRSVVLDLRTEAGVETFLALVARRRVVEAMRPGGLARGLGFERLREVNPRIVMCTISGYGMTGPYRDLPSHGIAYDSWAGVFKPDITPDGFPASPSTCRSASTPGRSSARSRSSPASCARDRRGLVPRDRAIRRGCGASTGCASRP